MAFRYYIVDPTGGDIWGTNDQAVAEDFSLSEDHYVIDVEDNQWVMMNTIGERFDIPEYKP